MTNLSRSCLATPVTLALAVALAGSPQNAHAQSINQRETTAQALIAGSRNSFSATGTSGVCGEIPKESSLTGVATFVVEFPSEDPGNQSIQSIAFGSRQPVGGVTKASVFRLIVAVLTANGARPPAYVLNTDPPGNPKNAGTATLTKNKGVLTLKVVGRTTWERPSTSLLSARRAQTVIPALMPRRRDNFSPSGIHPHLPGASTFRRCFTRGYSLWHQPPLSHRAPMRKTLTWS